MKLNLKGVMGMTFATVLLAISLLLILHAGHQFYTGLSDGKELINLFVQAINTVIISLALFELAISIGQEYRFHESEENPYALVRRTVARFVGTVCIALVLEALIMIIKYSQLELAGNLYYPVGILTGASILLIGMGIFLHLSRLDCNQPPVHEQNRPRVTQVTDAAVRITDTPSTKPVYRSGR